MKMSLISLHWLVLSAILITGSRAYDEEDEEVPSSSGRWSLHRERRHWHAAALACRQSPTGGGQGGRLAVPKSPREARALGRLLARAFPHPMDAPWVYLGLHDLAERGEFLSEDGIPIWTLGNLRWHAWDARGGPLDRCVVLDRFGLLWDVPCTWRLPFICAHPPPAEPTEPPCPTMESEGENVSKHFELHEGPSNWWSALAKCARTGGHLAIPHGSFHMHALRDLLREGYKAADDVSVLRAFVGVSDLARGGHLRNLHGELFGLSPSNYKKIYSPVDDDEATTGANDVVVASRLSGVQEVDISVGEDEDIDNMDPIAVPPGAVCLVLTGAGQYESAPCTSELSFFCERPPPAPTACPTPPPPPPDPRMLPPPPGHFWLQQGKVTWKQAAKGCLDAGGVLAVPETPGEALALADLLRSVPHPSDDNIGADIWAYVGIKDFAEDGDFFTIFGVNASVTTEEAAPWGPGQPNGEGSQPCVVLDRDATLWDVSCEWELGYLCRRFPAEPPWATRGPFSPAGDRGVSWRVHSTEMRRWLREMKELGAGAALKTEDGQEQKIEESARGFAKVDLLSWINEFDGGLFDYAKFDFNDPNALRT